MQAKKQKAGLKTRDNHAEICPTCGGLMLGSHYKRLGRTGGVQTFLRYGNEFMRAIGRLGGRPRKNGSGGVNSVTSQPLAGLAPPFSVSTPPLLLCGNCGCEFPDARGKDTEGFSSVSCPRCLSPVRRQDNELCPSLDY